MQSTVVRPFGSLLICSGLRYLFSRLEIEKRGPMPRLDDHLVWHASGHKKIVSSVQDDGLAPADGGAAQIPRLSFLGISCCSADNKIGLTVLDENIIVPILMNLGLAAFIARGSGLLQWRHGV